MKTTHDTCSLRTAYTILHAVVYDYWSTLCMCNSALSSLKNKALYKYCILLFVFSLLIYQISKLLYAVSRVNAAH